jgi:hypothetical protein
MAGGRPTDYTNKHVGQAYKLAKLGYTDKEIADFFEIAESTLNLWKLEHPEFSESLKKGKAESDVEVEESLRMKAIGFEKKVEEIVSSKDGAFTMEVNKYFPPDATSAIFWLKNRNSKRWRDSSHIDNTHEYKNLPPWMTGDESELEAPDT